MDQSYDPCENFYMFACGGYLKKHQKLPEGASRIGTYDETQKKVNLAVAKRLNNTSNLKSTTEQILKKVFCEKLNFL